MYDDERNIYYGFFKWDITPLTEPRWGNFFMEYSKMKTDFQRIAIAQQTQAMNFEEYASEIINSPDFPKTFKTLKDGRQVMQPALVRNIIYQKFPDMTENERTNILSQVKMEMQGDDEEN